MKTDKILKWLYFFLILAAGIGIFIFLSTVAQKCTDNTGYVQVRQTWLDSLSAQAQKPPDTLTVTIDSIIYIKGDIVYVEIPVTEPIDSITNYVPDILRNEHFTLFLYDTLRFNRIISRGYNYDLHIPKEIIKTITILRPIPFPYQVKDPGWLYGGINVGNVIMGDLSIKKDHRWYGIGMGYVTGQKFYYIRYQQRIW